MVRSIGMSKVPFEQRTAFYHPGQIPGYRTASIASQRAEQRRLIAQKQIKDGTETKPAPSFYAGETFGPHVVQFDNVARLPNGTLASKHNKFARRLIRKALDARYSGLTKSLRLAQGMKAQAYSIAREEHKSTRWARRLLAKELAIHQTVYAPSHDELRKMRTMQRARARKGVVQDAISALVDRMSEQKP